MVTSPSAEQRDGASQRRYVGNSSTAAAQANLEESARIKQSNGPDAKPGKPKDDPSLAPESGDKLDADKSL